MTPEELKEPEKPKEANGCHNCGHQYENGERKDCIIACRGGSSWKPIEPVEKKEMYQKALDEKEEYIQRLITTPKLKESKMKPGQQSKLPRFIHAFWAGIRGYFWLPCPICGRKFGGHENNPVFLYDSPHNGRLICRDPLCTEKAKQLNTQNPPAVAINQ